MSAVVKPMVERSSQVPKDPLAGCEVTGRRVGIELREGVNNIRYVGMRVDRKVDEFPDQL